MRLTQALWRQGRGGEARKSRGINGSLGMQSFTQNASSYFPTNPALQCDATSASATAVEMDLSTLLSTGTYAGSVRIGLACNVGGLIEYRVAPRLYLGGVLSLNNARNYRQATGSVHLRYVVGGAAEFGRPTGSGATLRPFSSPYTPML